LLKKVIGLRQNKILPFWGKRPIDSGSRAAELELFSAEKALQDLREEAEIAKAS
jgi:hypothetical protein